MTGMRGDRGTGVSKPFVASPCGRWVQSWCALATVDENSEQMGDVDEVLGQMLFHVGHDGEISKGTCPGGISAK